MKVFRSNLLVCGGTGCHASGSIAMKKALVDELNKRGLSEEIKIVETGCNGFCAQGPIIVVYPSIIYMNIRRRRPRSRRGALRQGPPPREALLQGAGQGGADPLHAGNPFFALQDLRVCATAASSTRKTSKSTSPGTVTRHGEGAHRGWKPEQIVQEVLKSGLRGAAARASPRGSVAVRFTLARGDEVRALLTADEGDPGAFMDRSVLEADPHAVLRRAW